MSCFCVVVDEYLGSIRADFLLPTGREVVGKSALHIFVGTASNGHDEQAVAGTPPPPPRPRFGAEDD